MRLGPRKKKGSMSVTSPVTPRKSTVKLRKKEKTEVKEEKTEVKEEKVEVKEEKAEVKEEVMVPKKGKRSTPKKSSQSVPAQRVSDLASLISSVAKKHGEGSLIQMNRAAIKDVKTISSGSLGLDYSLGIGGYPRGRIVEIYGPSAAGKSTLTLHAIAECQKSGGIAAFIDAEHALDLKYARQLGVNTEDLLFSQPDYGEQALDIVLEILKANIVDLVVVDSVAALTPKSEIDGDMEQRHVGLQARMMSQALRKLTAIVSKTDTCLIFINQIREKVGVMWGSNEVTPGGRGLKFYCSVRVDVRRVSSIKKGDSILGNRVKTKISKNKLAPPHRECQFDIIFGKGINSHGDLVDIACDYGLIEKSGSWFSYKGIQLGQGRDSAIKFVEGDQEIKNEIETTLRNDLFGNNINEDNRNSGEGG